jgi:hypothetical protein
VLPEFDAGQELLFFRFAATSPYHINWRQAPQYRRGSSRVIVDLLNRGVSVAGIAAREDLSRPELAPQRFEKIESGPGNGMASDASKPQHLVHGRAADRALRLEHRLKSGSVWAAGQSGSATCCFGN